MNNLSASLQLPNSRIILATKRVLFWGLTLIAVVAAFALDGPSLLLPWIGVTFLWMFRYKDISHPCFWFPPVFFLYGASYFLIVEVGLLSWSGSATNAGFLYESPNHRFAAIMHFVALVAFLAGAGRPTIKMSRFLRSDGIRQPVLIWAVLACLLLISVYHYAGVLTHGGLASKQDIKSAAGEVLALRLAAIYIPLSLISALILISVSRAGKHTFSMWLSFFILWAILGLLVTGERDILLRALIVGGFVWNRVHSRISGTLAMAGFALLVLLLPLLQGMKGFFIGGFHQVTYDVYGILGGEFKSAGRSFTAVLDRWPGFMYGETFIWDLGRIFSLGPFSSGVTSTTEWFNRELVGHDGPGWGFSLVAEFYLNFGVLAVILGFFVFGRGAYLLYSRQLRSPIWFAAYVACVPIFIYAIRGDMATLIGSPLKLVLLPVVLVIIGEKVFSKMKTGRTIGLPQ